MIQSTNDNIFGGYTEYSWQHIEFFSDDEKDFIFSLVNLDKKPLKMKFI